MNQARPLLIERNAPKISHDGHDEWVSDSHTFNDDVCSTGIVAEDYQYLFVLVKTMDQQLILLISFFGETGIVFGLALGLALSKKGPQRWLITNGLIGLLWAIFYPARWWTS